VQPILFTLFNTNN